MRGKYREVEGECCSKEVSDRYGVGFWKIIRKLWVIVNVRVSFAMGSGRRVKFWKDKWGVVMSHCVFLSPPYLPWLVQRRSGSWIYGINLMFVVVGLLVSLGV